MSAADLCDVAATFLLDDAAYQDQAAALAGREPSHVMAERRRLGIRVPGDDSRSGDADVIVLAEYTPRELAKELGLQ